jgi:hypothetical protein
MRNRLRKYRKQLEQGQPGSRFRDQFERNHKRRQSAAGRALRIAVGALLIPVGVFFLAVPGPGLVIIAIGAVMIAREFRVAADALDSLELGGRRAWRRLRRGRPAGQGRTASR